MQTAIIDSVRNDTLAALFTPDEVSTIARYAANIRAFYRAATPEQLLSGRGWYAEAHQFAVTIAREYGLTVRNAAAIIAVTSPSVSWANQLNYTRAMLDSILRGDAKIVGPFYNANKEKARRIVNGENADDVVSGVKVTAFWANVYGDGSVVTVDRHALRVALNADLDPEQCKVLLQPKSRIRLMALAAYHLAALQLAELPHIVQAVTWVVWRGTAE